ncbi:S9 family peptidase [Iamia sp. SCSIO 61187]|uniref:S9 family peptidase n=1 Tax=Iamia sp. SCSIO 61187 TaxID=2722752 RepID=UPI001C636EED|nr:S9 family peptidase [Iamia sp. SCSIO 61187]QYG94834.1 S9 family peptidase [Iamia sp. SCSIO 61187]
MLPDDIGHMVEVGAPAVSPDGRLVAWTVRRTDLDANRYRSAVWLAPTDGSRPPRQVTAGTDGDGEPTWSPDGTLLAFTSGREKDGDEKRSTLHLLPVDGPGEVVTLTSQPESISQLRWSPDGTRIAFACRQRTARYDEGEDDAARPPREVTRLLSMLDGEGWIVDRPTRIWVVPVDGSAPATVVTGAAPTGVDDGIGDAEQGDHGNPEWSPDSTRLAFSGGLTRDFDLDQRAGVYVAEVGSGIPAELPTTTPVVGGPVSYSALAWEPDGRRIAALEERLLHEPWNTRLAVIDVDSGEVTFPAEALDRTHAPYPGARPPVWDGDDLVFGAEDRGAAPIFRVPARGGEPTVVAGATGCVIAAWDLAGGTLAVTRTDPETLPEVVVLDPAGEATGASERRISHHTEAFHARCPAHPTERFTVPSPAGGDIDVWLVTPRDLDRSAGERHPVLLSIHGGPTTQYGERWFDEFQMWASAGFCVVFANPHGSTGRDTTWLRNIRSPRAAVDPGEGWGGDDHRDLIAALDGALERFPFLDPDRMGVLGGSYGGYMTTWIIGHTDRFAAACSERAVNDMLTLETTSDAMGLFGAMLGVDHLDDPDEFRRMSPITHVRDITTPVLILHSDEDWRCPVEQADKLYLALRKLGREVRYHRFPGEGHELSRSGSPKHRVQRARLIIDWFGQHLQPDDA